ncbi:MAG TPA: hypothetical protein VN660_13740 [Steroidobacteraceae bacterium]|nr:hypothetical protein [Steroidobacteraceae bacterium]
MAAIDFGAKDQPTKVARAQAALAVSSIFATAGNGDIVAAAQQFQALIVKTSDPGLVLLVNQAWAIGAPFLASEGQLLAAAPLIGSDVFTALKDTAAGMAAAANAYISAPAS